MSIFKRTQAVMLPTNQQSKIAIRKNYQANMIGTTLINEYLDYRDFQNPSATDDSVKLQHLYFLSNEEIKEGDYAISNSGYLIKVDTIGENEVSFIPLQTDVYCNTRTYHKIYGYKKVISTTDESLSKNKDLGKCNQCGAEQFHTYFKCNYNGVCMGDVIPYKQLPQPSQSFIQKYIDEYNKGNIITEVMVEYEEDLVKIYDNLGDHPGGHWEPNPNNNGIKLKVNPKNNTITIKPIKTNYNREEVIKLLIDCCGEVSCEDGTLVGKPIEHLYNWIKNNL